ncbi:alanine--tRNA ligase isoform X1 [Rhodamnia argentea]|uniref:Alanine--tRNA ligase isoform X1 n=1 Tax=Rhodamnia argentea TaxID=178133 RepID=A0A8B8QYS0_9MYRT|nr:alanine--tRNA ligase isoform X1 [Rhodamnia argentea]
MDSRPTKLDYYADMWRLRSKSTIVSFLKGDDGRSALVLDSTIFHPQGGGQPADTGFIAVGDQELKFVVEDVRLRDGIVYHYGHVENLAGNGVVEFETGNEVRLHVDEPRRKLNSRLHSAGHLLDVCMKNVGLDLEPGKGYHFPDGPFVEYKGVIPPSEISNKQKELETEANALISKGEEVAAALLPYDEALEQCGGSLPDYIPKESTPRIVKLGTNPGCPCGGTHVHNLSEIISMKVSQIRTKKGVTKVSYTVG